jgi:hypothetical protein
VCVCHPDTETREWKKLWAQVKKEPRTREDWQDLHDTIEDYRKRVVQRHTRTASREPGDTRP